MSRAEWGGTGVLTGRSYRRFPEKRVAAAPQIEKAEGKKETKKHSCLPHRPVGRDHHT